MTINTKRKSFHSSHLKFIAAPLVNQSDLPWRMLVAKYGATCTYTQMYMAKDLNSDPRLLQSLQQDLLLGRLAPENDRREEQVGRSGSDFKKESEERKAEIERLKLVFEDEIEKWERWKKEREESGKR